MPRSRSRLGHRHYRGRGHRTAGGERACRGGATRARRRQRKGTPRPRPRRERAAEPLALSAARRAPAAACAPAAGSPAPFTVTVTALKRARRAGCEHAGPGQHRRAPGSVRGAHRPRHRRNLDERLRLHALVAQRPLNRQRRPAAVLHQDGERDQPSRDSTATLCRSCRPRLAAALAPEASCLIHRG